MLGITTLMFAMGITTLVLVTIAGLQQMSIILSGNEQLFSIVSSFYAWAGGIACLMVCLTILYRLLDSIDSCLVYSMRHRLCLAHGGHLEQRQAHNCHPCDLHPWDLR